MTPTAPEDSGESESGHHAARRSSLGAAPASEPTWWNTVERTFFGVARNTWLRRIDDAGWRPDPLECYCPRCGGGVEGEGSTGASMSEGCVKCAAQTYPWHRVVRMGAYEGVLREAILEVKFSAWRRLGVEVARTLAPSVLDACEEAGVRREQLIIVPVPISRWRCIARGIDHTGAYARALGRELDVPVLDLLARKHRPAQTGRTLDQRRRNVAKTMYVRGRAVSPADLEGKVVLMLDDVMTSGATLREACRAIVSWREQEAASIGPGEGVANGMVREPMRLWATVLAVTDALDASGRPGHLSA